METRKLGRTGLEVSALGFGGSPIGTLAVAQGTVTEVVNLLLDSGVNVIDTAAAYHGSEEALGVAVGHRRTNSCLCPSAARPSTTSKVRRGRLKPSPRPWTGRSSGSGPTIWT